MGLRHYGRQEINGTQSWPGILESLPILYTEILCGLSLLSRNLILISLSFYYYHCFHNSLVDCTKEAAVHQHGQKRKNSQQLFFNIASWSHFFCYGSVNTAKQGEDGFLVCCLPFRSPFENTIQRSCFPLCPNCTNLNVYIQILMYIYES